MSTPISISILSADAIRRALAVRDLTDPAQGPHAMQALCEAAMAALRTAWGSEVIVERASPIVSIADNYDRLHYPPGAAARDARYTRYVCESALLRAHTTAMIPPLLRRLAQEPAVARDVLLVCPGLAYRRDSIDRLHTGEPHQLDLWRICTRRSLGTGDLRAMIERLVEVLVPGRAVRTLAARHPYTTDGLQIDVRAHDGEWVEIGECGLALPALLAESGLAVPSSSGLAMGLGLDRILMLRKGLSDIRLLRSTDPRVAAQMLDLLPYREVSAMPAVRRDLSLAVDVDATPEDLGDCVRAALGREADVVESIELLSQTAYDALPEAARARLGIAPGQKNLLVRVTLRALERTLTHEQCNALRDRIYAALHRGTAWQWASGG